MGNLPQTCWCDSAEKGNTDNTEKTFSGREFQRTDLHKRKRKKEKAKHQSGVMSKGTRLVIGGRGKIKGKRRYWFGIGEKGNS